MRHTGGRGWVWRETCSLGDCPPVTAAHNSCLCSLSLSVLSPSQSAADCWVYYVLRVTPGPGPHWLTLSTLPGSGSVRSPDSDRALAPTHPMVGLGYWPRGAGGQTDVTQQPPALRTTGTWAKTENSLQLKQLLTNCTITLLATNDQF